MTNVSQQRGFATTLGRRLLAITAITTAVMFGGEAQALAKTAEKTVGGGCRIGASVFEHWTKARHISYDDNGRCPKIKMYAVRRCWGRNYTYSYGPTTSDKIDRQWAGCDGIMTRTYAYDSRGKYLGSVEAWAK